jgi:hypothetical protein
LSGLQRRQERKHLGHQRQGSMELSALGGEDHDRDPKFKGFC